MKILRSDLKTCVGLCIYLFLTALALCGSVWASSAAAHGACCLCGTWDLGCPTRGRTHIPCVGRWLLNHWTTSGLVFLSDWSEAELGLKLRCFMFLFYLCSSLHALSLGSLIFFGGMVFDGSWYQNYMTCNETSGFMGKRNPYLVQLLLHVIMVNLGLPRWH